MKRLKLLVICSIFFQLLASCKDDEKPDGRIPITIEGFSLTSSAIPGGRLLTDGQWVHPFGEKINLVFVSQSTQTNYPIMISPDFSGELPQILLPPDNYMYYGNSDALQISPFLPVQLEGMIEVKAPSSVRLVGKTNYQLVSFSRKNLTQESRITLPLESPLFSNDGYYYAYVLPDRVFKAELVFQNGKKIQWGLDTQAFQHQSFSFRTFGETGQIPPLSDLQLNLSQSTVQLDGESVPDRMTLFYQTELSGLLKEASGLQWVSGRLFGVNDGGNPAEIYEVDSYQGQELRIIRVTNAPNIDWEDLAVNEQYLYIGDFGNNLGNRTDLRVLRIPVTDLLTKNEVQAEVISFSYDRQSGIPNPGSDHRFDCEAMVFHQGQLLLFTKPTNAQGSDVYTLNPSPGVQTAKYAGTFETKGWITGADLTVNSTNLLFSGYENAGLTSQAFLGLIKNPQLPALPGNPLKTIRLGSVANAGQTEGISISRELRIKIAGEQINLNGFTVPQRLSELDLNGILGN